MRSPRQRGFLLIEAIITVSVVLVVIASILALYKFIFSSQYREQGKLQGRLYAQEALEAASFVARYDWNQMVDGVWHPTTTDGIWQLQSGSELLEGRYSRSLTISPVSRTQSTNGQAFGEIVPTGGFADPETKLVTVDVSWDFGGSGAQTVQYKTYETRDYSLLWTQRDWSGGPGQNMWLDLNKFSSASNVDISAPGVLSLAGSYIDWSNATVTAEWDLPGNIDATSIFLLGTTLFVGTQNNSPSSQHEFFAFNVSNLRSPVLLGSLEITADVNGIYAEGSYASIATGDNTAELKIISISNPASMSVVKNVNLPSNVPATDVDYYNNRLYVTQGSTLYDFDYTNPASAVQKSFLSLGAGVLDSISIKGSQAYIASNIYTKELAVVDISDPDKLTELPGYDLPGNRQATDIFAFGLYAHVVTSNDGSSPEFYSFNISNPLTAPVLRGVYEVGENVYTVSALSNLAFIGSNLAGDDVLVLDVADPQNIAVVKGYQIKGTALAVYPTPEAIYLATTSNDSEVIIISVGSTNDLYPSSGYLESSTFDTRSASTTYNWLKWIGETTAATAVKLQLASNNDNTTWNYIGPDGTATSYYTTTTRALTNYAAHLNNRYLRYKVILESTDRAQTPYVYAINISYSP